MKNVDETENVDVAYDSFLKTFLMLYDRYCPLQISRKCRNVTEKHWTKGLSNICKKKTKKNTKEQKKHLI